MMRVRHLVLTSSFAGTESHVCVLASEQARLGLKVEVWGGDPAAMRRHLHPEVLHRPCPDLSAFLTHPRAGRDVDLVHAHMTKAEIVSLAPGSRGGAPVVTTRHFAAVRGHSVGGHLVRPFIRRGIAAQISVSEYVASRIDGPSRVIYAGVESRARPPSPRERIILVAQRLSTEKRTSDAVRAMRESGLAAEGWRMQIAGRGAQMENLAEEIQRCGLGASIDLLGFRNDIHDLMGKAAILLATAPAEPFGLTVAEAMAHSTPVVATGAGGHLESVGRASSPMLFRPGDVGQAAAHLVSLAASEKLRTTYGGDLRQVQSEWFTPTRQAKETLELYQEVLQNA